MSSGIFGVTPDVLLDAVLLVGRGDGADVSEPVSMLLHQLRLADGESLSEAGTRLYRTAWVLRSPTEARRDLGVALRQLLPIQVIEQERAGFGAVAEDGVLELLRLHRAVPAGVDLDAARKTFRWLNDCGVIAYSRRAKTVRSLAAPAEFAAPGEAPTFAAMISPRTPFSNVVRLRRVIRQLKGVVYWADPHFGARALEDLVSELDLENVSEVRILSGDATNVLGEKGAKDFIRFKQELALKSVDADWRVDSARDWHDRWLADGTVAYNMPPVNNLYQNQYAEILPASSLPPLDDWWTRSSSRGL